jgi:uncharacterized circularly permuted ATP-grasp superfamily protein/uncharacterized alpha-E superfamily protein
MRSQTEFGNEANLCGDQQEIESNFFSPLPRHGTCGNVLFMSASVLSASGTAPPGWDGEPASVAVIRDIQQQLGAMSPEHLERVFSLADELHEEDGAYFAGGEARSDARTGAGFDLMPMVIGGDEWALIESGLTQRVRAWNSFLHDVYRGQEILKAGVVPYEVVYADPNFHRGCARLPSAPVPYLQLSSFDLQRDARGGWMVVEENLGVAEGATYALRKRQVMRQVAPRLFGGREILPVEDFAAQVLDVLQELVRKPEGVARSVLLARGSGDDHYLDHAGLARQMGVPIVQGNDLVVLDSRLYLKTIAGMERVDVVLRRLATSLIDPVTFDGDSRFGVPGLLSCVRKGTLAVANGLGSDLANNRALAAHLPAIIEYYTGEKAILSSPHAFELRDIDVREEVNDKRDAYVIRHAWLRGPDHEWVARQMPAFEWNRFWQKVESSPSDYVAIRVPTHAQQPCWTASGQREQPATVRAFALAQDRVSSCALAWSGPATSLTSSLVQTTDCIKDVWILRRPVVPEISIFGQAEEAPRRLRLTSRVAESLFWMGRYAERAEATARVVRIVQTQPPPQSAGGSAPQRQRLWAALADINGLEADFFLKPSKELTRARDVPFYFLLDRKNRGSIIEYVRRCRQNAESVREHFPPEVSSVLSRLYLQLVHYAEQADTDKVRTMLEDRSLHQEIVTQLDELTGALEKHMLHDDAWHFWQLGVYAERSLMTILIVQQVLAPNEEGNADGASSANLDLLLQMLAGQYAYRSLFHARPVAARTARLLLQDADFPRSARFCLSRMEHALRATLGERPTKGAEAPLRHCERVIAELNLIDIGAYFPRPEDISRPGEDDLSDSPAPEFSQKLTELTDLLLDFNVLISDHYLDHQGVIREPELFDLHSMR